MTELKDKTVIVVGGATGIGLAIGKAFVDEGCKVALCGRTPETLDRAAELTGALTKICDASDREEVRALFAWAELELGAIDILVYSAGVNVAHRSLSNVDPAEFDQVMNINATGAFNCIHAVMPGMRERKSGLIFNIVSVAGMRCFAVSGLPYTASKFAQAAIGTYSNLEALPDGVRVTNVYPGETNTPIIDKRPEPPSAERRAEMLQPEDVAGMVVAVAKLPPRATVPELVITPPHMPLH